MKLLDFYRSQSTNEVCKPQVRIVDNQNGTFTISYLHLGVDFNDKRLRMARGLTIDGNSNIIIRGYEKFFNYMQLEDTPHYSEQFKNERSRINCEQIHVTDKLDGSLILLSNYKGKHLISTTSSARLETNPFLAPAYHALANVNAPEGFTLAFEWTSPNNTIVIPYSDDHYTLHGAINNETGKRMNHSDLVELSKELNVSVVPEHVYSLDELLDIQKNAQGIEGFVAENEFGNLIKFKTEFYFAEAKKMGLFFKNNLTKSSIKDVVNLYLNDEIDDYLAFENQHDGHVIKDVLKIIHQIENDCQSAKECCEGLTRKEIGLSNLPNYIKAYLFNGKLKPVQLANTIISKIELDG